MKLTKRVMCIFVATVILLSLLVSPCAMSSDGLHNVCAAGGGLTAVSIQTPAAADNCSPDYEKSHYVMLTQEVSIDDVNTAGSYEHGIMWKRIEGSKISKNEKFTFGDTYELHIILKPNTGYQLPDEISAYNIVFRGVDLEHAAYLNSMSNNRKEAVFFVTAKYGFSSMDIEIEQPVAGDNPIKNVSMVDQLPKKSFYKEYVDSIDISDTWYESSNGNNYTKMQPDDVYKEGYYYKTSAAKKIVKELKDNFLNPISGTIDGDLTGAYDVNDQIVMTMNYCEAAYTYSKNLWNQFDSTANESFVNGDFYIGKPNPSPIREIYIKGYIPPTTGLTKSYNNYASEKASDYEIYSSVNSDTIKNGISWSEVKGGGETALKVNETVKFVKDRAYWTRIHVKAKKSEGFLKDVSKIKAKVGGFDAVVSESEIPGVVIVTVKNVALDPITEFKYTVSEPEIGKEPGKLTFETTPEGAISYLKEFDTAGYWQVSDDGKSYTDMTEGAKFEAGKYYRTNAVIKHRSKILSRLIMSDDIINKNKSYRLGSVATFVNGRDINNEGVLDAEKYIVFGPLEEKKVDAKTDSKIDSKTDSKTETSTTDAKQPSKDSTSDNNYVEGVGTFSPNGKTLTDDDGKKYRVSETVKTKELRTGVKIADKKSGGKYRITKITKKKGVVTGGTVEYMAPYNKNCKLISATGIVKLAGVKFKVTSIAQNCAKGCTKLNKVILGIYITSIGKNAFKDCSKLRIITIKSTRITKIGANAFKGINKKATINVPKTKKKVYIKLLKGKGQPKTTKIK